MRHVGVKQVRVFAGYTALDLRDDEQPTTTRERANARPGVRRGRPGDRRSRWPRRQGADRDAAEEAAQGGRAQGGRAAAAGPGRVAADQEHAGQGPDPHARPRRWSRSTRCCARARRRTSRPRARQLQRLFFNPKRYDLGRVGRYKINQRLRLKIDPNHTVLTEEDFIAIIRYLIDLHDGRGYTDDIDHLGNRRIRSVGELIANQFSVGLSRMARLVKERMSINSDPEKISLDDLVNARTVSAGDPGVLRVSSQLSQFMDQTNPLAELTNKRRLSAPRTGRPDARARRLRGPRRALLAVRPDVPDRDAGRSEHRPDHQPLDLRADQRPRLHRDAVPRGEERQGHRRDPLAVGQRGRGLRGGAGQRAARRRRHASPTSWCSAASGDDYPLLPPDRIDFMDVAPEQLVSIAAALIPFLEHDDANRALMGSNMQRQSVPLLFPQAPLVGTGLEEKVARDSGAVIIARRGRHRHPGHGRRDHHRRRRRRAHDKATAARPAHAARPLPGEEVLAHQPGHRHQPAAAGARGPEGRGRADHRRRRRHRGRRAGARRNVLVAFMPWYGHNFEDAIVLSERLVKDDVYSSIHIQELELHVRDTKRGPGGDHAGNPQRLRRVAGRPRRARHRPDRRPREAGRHPGRQDHAEGRDRAVAGREAADRDLRREGEGREGLVAQGAAGHEGRRHRREDLLAASRTRWSRRTAASGSAKCAGIENEEKARITQAMLEELHRAARRAGSRPDAQGRHGGGVPSAGHQAHAAALKEIDLGDVDLKTLRVARQGGQRADPRHARRGRARAGQGRGEGRGPDRQDPPARRAARRA